VWNVVRDLQGDDLKNAWRRLSGPPGADAPAYEFQWNLAGNDYGKWFRYGACLTTAPAKNGEFSILAEGDKFIGDRFTAGVYSDLLSSKDNAVLTSPRFTIQTDEIYVRAIGGNGARLRIVVDNYPRGDGPIYPVNLLADDQPRWYVIKTKFWKGSQPISKSPRRRIGRFPRPMRRPDRGSARAT
jgi:hypothetical protein